MTRFPYFARLLAVLFLIFEASPAFADDDYLDELALRALFPGQYEAELGDQEKAVISANLNGDLSGRLSRGWHDKGRWWITTDSLCISWSVWTGGKPICGRVQQDGEWYTASEAGKSLIKFKRLPTQMVDKSHVVRGSLGPLY